MIKLKLKRYIFSWPILLGTLKRDFVLSSYNMALSLHKKIISPTEGKEKEENQKCARKTARWNILRLRGTYRAVIIHFRWKKAWFVPEIYDIPHQGLKSIRKASKQGRMFIFTVGGGQGGELFVRRPMGRVCTCLMATVYQAVTISM
ncbi:hypothetical protein KY289_003302 [Solanum tuberosum]|nr:hypothetical protein KY289_003302 [Solanum tuberosum]